jgi:hypothetical protein
MKSIAILASRVDAENILDGRTIIGLRKSSIDL